MDIERWGDSCGEVFMWVCLQGSNKKHEGGCGGGGGGGWWGLVFFGWVILSICLSPDFLSNILGWFG